MSLKYTYLPSVAVFSLVLFSLAPVIATVLASNNRQLNLQSETFMLGSGDSADTSSIVAKHDLKHVLDCAVACASTAGCKSFFFGSLISVCQIHNKILKQRKDGIQHNGLQYFYKGDDRTEADVTKRLIYAAYRHASTDGFLQYIIQNNTLTTYTPLKVRMVTDAFYIWTVNKLVVSTQKPGRVFTALLDSPSVTQLKKVVFPQGLGVDVKRQIIFVANGPVSVCKLSKMTYDGDNWQTFYEKRIYSVKSLVTDSVHRKLYFTNTVHIATIGYDGEGYNILYSGGAMYALAVHPSGDSLYYNDMGKMYNVSLTSPNNTVISDLKFHPRKFLFCGDRIYVTAISGSYKLGFVQGNAFSVLPGIRPSSYRKGVVVVTAWKCPQD